MTKEAQALRQPMIDRVNKLLIRWFDWLIMEQLQPDTTLGYDMDLTYMERIECCAMLENEFGVTISQTEWDGVRTLADLYNLIEAHLDANQAAGNEATNARR